MQYSTESHKPAASAPLHEILWAFGRQFFVPPAPKPRLQVTDAKIDGSLGQAMERLTVQQLGTAMRMHGIEGEDETMLASLESMVLAGEIGFEDFIKRVQNLFAKTLDALDVTLRMKIAVMLLPPDAD